MFSLSILQLSLRPRNIRFTPPPLARRMGDFKCRVCNFKWHSEYVWVTKTTEKVYQGQNCERCGSIELPYHVGHRYKAVAAPGSRSEEVKSKRRLFSYSRMNRSR
jgi:hypothetical protein